VDELSLCFFFLFVVALSALFFLQGYVRMGYGYFGVL
jgi:hypothetical protein